MGAGVVGTALAAWLARAAIPVTGLHGRQLLSERRACRVVASTGDLPAVVSEADVIIIAVRDERIPEVAARLASEGKLRPGRSCFTPRARTPRARSLPRRRRTSPGSGRCTRWSRSPIRGVAIEGLEEVAFGIEGDEPARAMAERIVGRSARGRCVLEAENLALYHAGAVMASNYVVALADTAQALLVKAGVPKDQALPVLIPLLMSVVQNLAELGLPGALTGPVERGDVTSVERHLAALSARAPEAKELYRLLGPRRASAGAREREARAGPCRPSSTRLRGDERRAARQDERSRVLGFLGRLAYHRGRFADCNWEHCMHKRIASRWPSLPSRLSPRPSLCSFLHFRARPSPPSRRMSSRARSSSPRNACR